MPPELANTTRRGVIDQFKAFIRHHSAHDKRPTDDPLSYRQQLNKDTRQLSVDLVDVKMFNGPLGAALEDRPTDLLPLVRSSSLRAPLLCSRARAPARPLAHAPLLACPLPPSPPQHTQPPHPYTHPTQQPPPPHKKNSSRSPPARSSRRTTSSAPTAARSALATCR